MASTARFQIGQFWLEYREERDRWCIAWYDRAARTRRRIQTRIGGGTKDDPPVAAKQALAMHHAANERPPEAAKPAEARLSPILTQWLDLKASKLARAEADGYAIRHWQTFIDGERSAGRLNDPVTVADIRQPLVRRYIAQRLEKGISGQTVSGEVSSLRRALNWALKEEIIESAPFIPAVDKDHISGPRELEYSIEQVAAILDAAASREDRHHVRLFTLIALSTHGRTEAILELHSSQIRKGLIFFNAPGRKQTSKRRSTVPIAPTLKPWLDGIEGKVIRYRAKLKPSRWADPNVPEYFERDSYDIGRAFNACLIEAGIYQEVDGVKKGIGTPNTLRHTIHTYLQTVGAPQAQIDMAAGHQEPGSGRNYTHLRPEYLKEFIEAVEAYWEEMRTHTKSHLRSHCGPKVHDLAIARAAKSAKK
jgi:site-specific recombinase XerD